MQLVLEAEVGGEPAFATQQRRVLKPPYASADSAHLPSFFAAAITEVTMLA